MTSMRFFKELPFSRLFWSAILLGAVLSEGVALFFQYVLHEDPCAICVHIRAYVAMIGLAAVAGLLLSNKRKIWMAIPHVALLGSVLKISMLSEQAVRIEKGTLFSTCGIDAGFPAWLPLDSWLPSVFAPTGLCGRVIPIIPGWTAGPSMSEVLHYGSMTVLALVVLLIFESCVLMMLGHAKKAA